MMDSPDWLTDQRGTTGLLIFVLAYAVATVLFIPGSPMTLAAGFVFGLWQGFIAVWLGATLGAAVAFLAGRGLARSRVMEKVRASDRFRKFDGALVADGWKIVFLFRLSPIIPFNLVNYFFALSGIRFWPYFWATAIGITPGTLMYVYLGALGQTGVRMASGHENGGEAYKNLFLGMGLLATAVLTWWLGRTARRILQKSSLSGMDKRE